MNIEEKSATTEIFEKFKHGDVKYAQKILNERIVSSNLCDHNSISLLHWVVVNNYLSIAELLLNYGANPNLQGGTYKETPLHWAIRMKYFKMIQLLIQNGANLSIHSLNGYDALHMACEIGDSEMVFLLLSSNADPNSLNGSGNTPLIALLQSEYPPIEDIFRLLIRFGADVTARESETNNTVFHLLNNKMTSSRLPLLLSSCSPSTPFTATNSSQMTPLQMAHISNRRNVLLWNQLWMYYNLPSWLPIFSTCLTCLLFLMLIDTLGWIYGFLTIVFLTILIFDKLSQGFIERGVFRIHQGIVWGFYLSIIWINLRYFGGFNYLQDLSHEENSKIETTSSEKFNSEEGWFYSIGRHIPSKSTDNLSSPELCLGTCVLSLCSLLLATIASFKKPTPHISTEDRSHLLTRIIKSSQHSSPTSLTTPGETPKSADSLDDDSGSVNLCTTCLIDKPALHCQFCETCPSEYFEQHFTFINNCVGHGNRRLFCLFIWMSCLTSIVFAYNSGSILLSHNLFTEDQKILSFFDVHWHALGVIPSIEIMFWLSCLVGGIQMIFLAQQLYLIGHETTSFYVTDDLSSSP